jgi:hypothetical protein
MKQTMKISMMSLSLISALALTACSHKNQLSAQPNREAEEFLINASAYAEKELGYKQGFGTGSMYFVCMEEGEKDCPKLYKYMAKYAKKTKGPFSSVTRADFEDKEAYGERRKGGW